MTREEAINAITQFVENYACGSDLIGLNTAIETLKKERPHGEWKYESYGQYLSTYKCSNCGFHGDKQWICCPYCGTDMRKRGEENE